MELSFESLTDGMEFSANIDGIPCVGKIAVFSGFVYLCQNKKSGALCGYDKRHGYNSSWIIRNPAKHVPSLSVSFAENRVTEFKILNKRKDRITEFYNQH